ncbi:MAG: ATP-binding cassette domain-containing protein [Sneathiella sp.]|nr:ATP-binding cassette domain-containing protein [Sneathiella sp.]
MSDTPAKIKMTGVEKRFGANKALDGLDLSVNAGEILTLIGPSGSGKSLALKSIVGLERPNGGTIELDGARVDTLRGEAYDEFLKQFGILFQRSGLFDGLPVWENIGFRLLQLPGATRKAVREQAAETLRSVGLSPDAADLFPAELSGGMQKRVGIARALAGNPPILFLDEPTAGLDPIMSNVINNLVLENVRSLGSTAIVATSNLVTASRISDKIVMLHEGRSVWAGTPDETTTSDNPYLYQFWNKKKDGPIKMPVSSMAFQ